MNGVVLHFLINQSDSLLHISQGNKGMRSYVLYGNGDFNLRPVKCATSDDNYAGASWSNEGEFKKIIIKEFEGGIKSALHLVKVAFQSPMLVKHNSRREVKHTGGGLSVVVLFQNINFL